MQDGALRYSEGEWLRAAEAVERRFWLPVRTWSWIAAACGAAGAYATLAFVSTGFRETDVIVKSVLLFFCAGLIIPLVFMRQPRDVGRMRNFYRNRLEPLAHSGLAGRMLAGDLTGSEITPHTAWYVRWLVPVQQQPRPEATLARVAASLDWYLGPPRRHWRGAWRIGLTFIAMLLYFGLAGRLVASAGFHRSGLLWLAPMLMPVASMTMVFAIMSLSFLHFYAVCASMLTHYLRLSWREEGQDAERAAAEPGAATQKLLLIVNQLQLDLDTSSRQLNGFISAAFMPVMILGMDFPYIWALPVYLLSAAGLLVGFYYLRTAQLRRYRARLDAELERSGFAELLASGELKPAGIAEYVPWIFRWQASFPRAPKGYGDDLRRALWVAAYNLDWFLAPPRLLVRPAWIALYFLAALLPASFALQFLLINSMITHIAHNTPQELAGFAWRILSILLVIGVCALLVDEYLKVRHRQGALVAALRRRLAA